MAFRFNVTSIELWLNYVNFSIRYAMICISIISEIIIYYNSIGVWVWVLICVGVGILNVDCANSELRVSLNEKVNAFK